MSTYPYSYDDNSTIYVVNDNISEISGQNFNQVRDAVFKIEEELGIKPSGTLDSLKEFLDVSFNTNGTVKAAALTAIGLVTLPIDNAQVGVSAGIAESKLNLDYSTSSLRSLIATNSSLITSLQTAVNGLTTSLGLHIGGGSASVRHVASHVDINAIPSDSRDPSFVWSGLLDTSGNIRSATNVGRALEQINNELVGHEIAITGSHPATAISVDTSNFMQLSEEAIDVQTALEELDASEDLRIGLHRAIQHSSGVPGDARSSSLITDGYGDAVVSLRQVQAYVAAFPGTGPVDDVNDGDQIVRFNVPTSSTELYQLDSEFSQVKPGDILRIVYGDGYNFEAQYIVESLRYSPGIEFCVRLDSNNLLDTTDAYARIDRALYDPNVYGIAISAPCNATPTGYFPGFYSSVTVADPRCASVLGIGFDPNQIDSTHYNLYLELYPTGNPAEKAIVMPAVDVSGNSGATPGQYTLDSVVLATNNVFRQSGYNMRFLAFQYAGNFGIAMTDPFDGAAFSIINGDWSSGSGVEGSFTENVIGDYNVDNKYWDALGLSFNAGNWASPAYRSSYTNSTDAQNPSKIIMPRKQRYYVADGSARDYLRSAIGVYDGYWLADITARTVSGVGVSTTYTIYDCLNTAGLKPGKTITVLPNIGVNSASYNSADYGRFIIESVVYQPACPGDTSNTIITVLNGIHATGSASSSSTGPGMGIQVRIHFGNDTVGFDLNNMIDSSTPSAYNYHRFHEIYANKGAKTVSHERARMPIHGATATALDSTYWHINYVSSKLRGYRDNTANFNKYIRLSIDTYDITTGEFTARIGRRPVAGDTQPPSTTTIANTGITATGKKNVPFKVFDETGNDYIELEYVETSTSPTTIVPVRVVDIEVMPSLMEDDELTLISTCEMNWSGGLLVERVRDQRQVGSISEKEFTASAKSFITAGDRALHANGVIRDLDCLGATDVVDTRALYFNGGLAFINGNIVSVNNSKILIPRLIESGGSAAVNWVVCVNEDGALVSLPITATKQQFFAQAGSGGGTSYFVPSVTFTELITERKDLLPLATLTASGSLLSSILDIRRFAADESFNIPFVWAEDETNFSASFRSAEALQNWITLAATATSQSFKQKVIVRGTIVLSTALDFSAIPNLVLEADGIESATIVISSTVGIKVADSVSIRNINFIYGPSLATGNNVNISLSAPLACVLIKPTLSSSTINNINIENCSFFGAGNPYRYPFIYMILNNNIVENCSIIGNSFSDTYATTSAAIVIANSNTDGLVHSILNNVFIEKNICAQEQGIFIVGTSSTALPPITAINVHISKNKCGYIGVSAGSNIDPEDSNNQPGLFISENACNAIYGAVDIYGQIYITVPKTLASTIVRNNSCSTINFNYTSNATPRTGQSAVILDGNILTRSVFTTTFGAYDTHLNVNYGINVYDNVSAAPQLIPAKIINNSFQSGSTYSSATVLEYTYGIRALSPCVITGNTIRAFTTYGIYTVISTYTEATGSIISNNYLFRGTNSITYYIVGSGAGIITDNYLDKTTVDGTSEITIDVAMGRASPTIVERNINHVITFPVKTTQGTPIWTYGTYRWTHWNNSPIYWGKNTAATNNSETIQLRYDSAISTSAATSRWCLPLKGFIPSGAYIMSATIYGETSVIFATTGNITLRAIYNELAGDYGTVITTASSGTNPMNFAATTIANATIDINRKLEENVEIEILADLQTSAVSDINLTLIIKYRF